MTRQRPKRGVLCSISALGVLIAMTLNIGGTDEFTPLIRRLAFVFLVAALIAFAVGCALHKRNAWWSVLAGGGIGLAVGFAILFWAVSNI